jgi:hypothetical protein
MAFPCSVALTVIGPLGMMFVYLSEYRRSSHTCAARIHVVAGPYQPPCTEG